MRANPATHAPPKERLVERPLARLRALRGRIPALRRRQQGRWGYILLWLLGVPIPILFLIYLLRGCN